MIDAGEPKDGDYVRYLEGLAAVSAASPERASGQASDRAGEAAPHRSARRTPSDGTGATPSHAQRPPAQRATMTGSRPNTDQARQLQETLETRLQQLRQALPGAASDGLPRFVHQAGRFAFIAGIALIALSFVNHPPFFADPVTGLVLIAASVFLRRLARKLP